MFASETCRAIADKISRVKGSTGIKRSPRRDGKKLDSRLEEVCVSRGMKNETKRFSEERWRSCGCARCRLAVRGCGAR
jgi:hypothetical protein